MHRGFFALLESFEQPVHMPIKGAVKFAIQIVKVACQTSPVSLPNILLPYFFSAIKSAGKPATLASTLDAHCFIGCVTQTVPGPLSVSGESID
jgi:hypothetical protein